MIQRIQSPSSNIGAMLKNYSNFNMLQHNWVGGGQLADSIKMTESLSHSASPSRCPITEDIRYATEDMTAGGCRRRLVVGLHDSHSVMGNAAGGSLDFCEMHRHAARVCTISSYWPAHPMSWRKLGRAHAGAESGKQRPTQGISDSGRAFLSVLLVPLITGRLSGPGTTLRVALRNAEDLAQPVLQRIARVWLGDKWRPVLRFGFTHKGLFRLARS